MTPPSTAALALFRCACSWEQVSMVDGFPYVVCPACRGFAYPVPQRGRPVTVRGALARAAAALEAGTTLHTVDTWEALQVLRREGTGAQWAPAWRSAILEGVRTLAALDVLDKPR